MEADGLSLRTVLSCKTGLEHLSRFLGGRSLLCATVDDLRAWVVTLRTSDYRPNTQNRYWRSVRLFYRWASAEGHLQYDPTTRIKGPKGAQPIVRPFDQIHIRALLQLCPHNTWWGARDAALVVMLLTTGARAEELMRLKMEDVDLSRRTVLLKGKGDRQQAIKERVVTLTPNAVQALLRWMNHRGRILTIAPELREHLWLSYVVPHKRWCPMTVNALKHMLADLGRNAGITDRRVSAHTFRHTFGTWMWIEETPLPQLQYMMGHKDIRSTMVYVRCGAEIAGRMEQKQRDPFRMWF